MCVRRCVCVCVQIQLGNAPVESGMHGCVLGCACVCASVIKVEESQCVR